MRRCDVVLRVMCRGRAVHMRSYALQEVSNKELRKALQVMQKAEDHYYNSKGWSLPQRLLKPRDSVLGTCER